MERNGVILVTYADLQSGATPGGEVRAEGGGVVRGVDLSGWAVSWLLFAEEPSLLREILPRPLSLGGQPRRPPGPA